MKKFLFLMLSAAIAVSASAGINLKQAKQMSFETQKAMKMDKKADSKSIMSFSIQPSERVEMIKGALKGNRGASDVISDQPAGELKTYTRSGYATYVSNQQLSLAQQGGEVNIVYDEDGETVWIQDPICYLDFGTWVRGTISGNKITLPMGQFISWNDSYNYGRILAWGTWINGEGYTTDESVTECTFTIDGIYITLDNSTFGTDPYSITGLTSIWDDDLTWGNYIDGETVWTGEATIYPNVENLTAVPTDVTADVTWEDENCTEWYLRYREYKPNGNYYWDFETEDSYGEWSSLDSDEDGFEWEPVALQDEGVCPSGVGCFASYCYNPDTYDALTPEDYLISPDVILHGELSFYAWAASENWADDHFIVYVLTEAGLTQIAEDTQVTGTPTKYTYDLSNFDGQVGDVIIVHTGCTDQLALLIDDVFIGDPNSDVYVDPWTYAEEDITETKYTITGLTPETTYEVQVVGFTNEGHSYWSESAIFTTLAEAPAIPDVYILGEVNSQNWAPNAGTMMAYDEETGLYTATVTLDGRNEGYNFFSFTNVLAEYDDQGSWDYIAPYRFGAVADGDFEVFDQYLGAELALTYDGGKAYKLAAGEYKLTVNLATMKLVIEKIGTEPHFLLGDANDDGEVNVVDVTTIIDYLMTGNVTPWNEDNANVDQDDTISIADVTVLIDMLLSGK